MATFLPPDFVYVPEHRVDDAIEAAAELMKVFRRGGPDITKAEALKHLKTLVKAVKAAGGEELATRAANKSMRGEPGAGTWIYDAFEHAAALEEDESDGAVRMEFGHAHTIVMLGADPELLDFFFQ